MRVKILERGEASRQVKKLHISPPAVKKKSVVVTLIFIVIVIRHQNKHHHPTLCKSDNF